MRKLFLILVMIFVVSSIPICSQTVVNVNGLRFLIDNGNAIVGRQDKELSGDIVIPASIEYEGQNYPVTSFVQPTNLTAWSGNSVTTEGGAFQSCPITSIVIPTSISNIEAGAFSGCTNLKSVDLPDNLKGIGAASFSGCTSLESIEIPETVVLFGSNSVYGFVSYTFGGCSKLKTIHIPSGVTTLYAGCFMGAGLDSIYIPKTVTSLYDDCLSSSSLRIVKMGIADLTKLTYSQTCFGTNNINNANLYVPKGSISVYQEYEPWSKFKSLQEYGEEGETFVPDQININYEGIKYILKEGVATITRQPKTLSGDIVIPEKVLYNEVIYPVTGMVEPTDLVCYSDNSISCTGGAFQGSAIESITIPSTITTIAAGAFQNCGNLKKVVLPPSIKILSAACFAGCYNLEDINIPDGITDIASYTRYGYRSYVFGGCSKIKSFVIPSGVTTLASGCFLNSGLETISIPSGCTSMADDCLDADNLTLVTIFVRDLDNLSYTEACFGNVSNTELRVPKGSKRVYQEYYPWMSFKCIEEFDDGKGEFVPSKIIAKIDNIRYILNENDAIIGRQNKDLSGDIVIPSSVSYEGKKYTVSSMVEPTNLIAWSSNTVSTENGAFQACPISSITLPSTIKIIPAGAFYGCLSLENINLPEGITQLGAACFANCSKIVEIQIPESVNRFGSNTKYGEKSYIFGNCTSLKKVNIPKNIDKFTEGCFKGSGLETFIIPSNIVKLEEDCFSMDHLRGIKITHTNLDALKYTESIFSNVTNVSLYVPEGTATLYQEYYPWKNFEEIVEYKEQNDEFNFNAYSLTYILPDEVMNARKTRYSDNSENIYEKEYFASGITVLDVESPQKEGYTFLGWIDLPETMPAHDVTVTGSFTKNEIGGSCGANLKWTYEIDTKILTISGSGEMSDGQPWESYKDLVEKVVIEDGVTSIGTSAFYQFSNLTTVIIPSGVTKINEDAFNGCDKLQSVDIPNSVTVLGACAFKGCANLSKITMSQSITTINDGLFGHCPKLAEISIPEGVTSVGNGAFEECSFTSFVIPSSVTKLGVGVFASCSKLEELTCLPQDVPTTDNRVFDNLKIDNITLKVPAASARKYKELEPWKNFKEIVKIGKAEYSLTYMVDGEVYKTYQIEEGATITPEPAPTKEGYTFSGWSEIPDAMPDTDLTITGTFTINKYKLIYKVDGEFYKDYEIEYGASITPEPAPTKEGYEFSGWSDIPSTMPANNVEITGSFKQIDYKFEDTTYEISGEGTVSIKGGDQKGNVEISGTVVINGQTYKVTAIAENAFVDNTQITSVTIPEGVTTIGSNAFSGCVNLLVINIGKSVSSIGNKAFANVGTSSAAKTRGKNSFIVNCYAESVPQTAADAFENSPITTGSLLVNDNIVDAYKITSPWSQFGKIQGFQEAAGFDAISIDNPNAHIYDMQGNRIDNLQKGVNIIRVEDSKTKKVIVK